MDGHAMAMIGERHARLLQRAEEGGSALRQPVAELARRGRLKVDDRSVWSFLSGEKLKIKNAGR
jgi:hypothetical protein